MKFSETVAAAAVNCGSNCTVLATPAADDKQNKCGVSLLLRFENGAIRQ